jgi:bud site selection protein 20
MTLIASEKTDAALRTHWRSKLHKRRCKKLKEPAYTIEEAEVAAGLGREPRKLATATALSNDGATGFQIPAL